MRRLIRNAMIFDGTGTARRPGTVLVEGNRIVAVDEDGSLDAPDAELVDGTGCTLMPGMVEAHAHLSWGSSVEHIYHQFLLPPEELKVATWRNARVLLDHGFTSAYSAGALGDGLEVALKREIEAGTTPGPRLIASTLERSPEGAEGVDTGNIFNGRGAAAMRAFLRYCADEGVDSVKLVISGEDALKPGSAREILYTPEEMAAAGETARDLDLWIACHAYTTQALKLALGAGARIVYHCSFLDEAGLDALEAAKDRVFYGPGCGVSVAALEATPPPHIDMSSMKASAAERMELEARLVPELKKRGLRILIGGDYGFPFNPNGRNARDLAHFVRYFGYTPLEALSAATMLGGQLMGRGDELGIVRSGYLADLLLVEGDPTRDVSILQDKSRLRAIWKDGVPHKLAIEDAARGPAVSA